ncbi:MAG: hypothetical protein Q4A41_04295, partial [Bacillota bacterium]|nr:hypothetical protein [Bacillota bacterium]
MSIGKRYTWGLLLVFVLALSSCGNASNQTSEYMTTTDSTADSAVESAPSASEGATSEASASEASA